MIKNLFKTKKALALFSAFVLISFLGKIVFATPPTSPYTPGETLNPTCLPTDINCDVQSPWSVFGSDIARTNGNVGIGTTAPEFKLSLDDDGGILAKGTFGSGADLTTEGTGARMFWYPKKAAFRAGYVAGPGWDDVNIGEFSTAFGRSTTASGYISTAFGWNSTASGERSTAFGFDTTASGFVSTAFGDNTTAIGDYSTAFGRDITLDVDAIGSVGIGLDGNSYTVSAPSVFSIMGGNVGIGTTAPEFKLSLDDDGGILAKGTFGSGTTLTTEGAGTRMFWYPKKSAFRVGNVAGAQWDDVNIGEFSTAFGYDTTASGFTSTAFGRGTTASGNYSTAFGRDTTASHNRSTAFGANTTASGLISTAFGANTTASGDYSTAFGSGTTASGDYSTAFGLDTTASDVHSTAFGRGTTASGFDSTAFGRGTTASGIHSTAFGRFTTASGYLSTAFGRDTTASGYLSTAFGVDTTASGDYSTAFGRNITLDGDAIGSVGIGLDGGAYTVSAPSVFSIMGGNVGIGTTAPADILHLTTGNLRIGASTAVRATTAGTNQLILFNGTAPVGTLVNGVSLYSVAGAMWAMDAAGNATQQSPHDLVTNNWIFNSTNQNLGKSLTIDMELMMKKLNETMGWDFVHETINGVLTANTPIDYGLTLVGMDERIKVLEASGGGISNTNSGFFGNITAWLADATNGIGNLFADRIYTKELCVSDESGETCITRTQLNALIIGAGVANPSGGNNSSGGGGATCSDGIKNQDETDIDTGGACAVADTTAPVITLNGASSIDITVGGTYTEAGATTTDNVDTSVAVVISGTVDTETEGTYEITYNTTDTAGNVATPVTRTVNVVAAT